MPVFHEFFAGGGMVRAGLGAGWTCAFANDFDPRKAESYVRNWGAEALRVGDVAEVAPDMVPGRADLAWASFPCQDLSLAGAGAGLAGGRSGAFYPFWRVIDGLAAQGRAPRIVAVENVVGTLTSAGGADFRAICETFLGHGYRPGALVIDAALFTPQSRPRLFVIGFRGAPDPALTAPRPEGPFHAAGLVRAVDALPAALREALVWWRLPPPPPRATTLADILEDDPSDAPWRTPEHTARLLSLMAPAHRARVEAAAATGARMAGCVYRRTRRDETGARIQRAEIRFDGLAGCLRTPGGGSSRQTLLVVEGRDVRSRLLSAREMARLMGLPDGYRLPARLSDACHLTGDGVAVDVVAHLRAALFEPMLAAAPAGALQSVA
ncbi:DNA cytosine methyltransferase [Rubrimonas cliftonensis]|uniref:DNA (cytosine-5-)-methyltransferase n=1 Tax=Rubrimonas cliftonensis TaxID=89524 RepID=A0A1H3VVI4_9RHOB|nr:DNA (cytosine-5-)-methyltransferase [Rubrimonas cliftonensis]SDZ78779.1 DNA (cytosine-5)-methyltransferase 1 [Rubrimonas cliftonensis]